MLLHDVARATLTVHAIRLDAQDDASASQRWQPPGTRPSGLAGRGAPAQEPALATAGGPRAAASAGASQEATRSDVTPRRPIVELSMKIAGASSVIDFQSRGGLPRMLVLAGHALFHNSLKALAILFVTFTRSLPETTTLVMVVVATVVCCRRPALALPHAVSRVGADSRLLQLRGARRVPGPGGHVPPPRRVHHAHLRRDVRLAAPAAGVLRPRGPPTPGARCRQHSTPSQILMPSFTSTVGSPLGLHLVSCAR